ncbi:receiver/sensor box histidine kinase [Halobellus limi]|uniref:histidine kinase n=1 Tax=Halobellus limi TaxID=699433 RepID=A0A1H5WK74_9EURY|nr:PAS domain S-box protein [Halobellus limi]QCC46423.1 PAS domain S-box protein [Halobellus limi]SEF99763.1 PAS domain S-box-containing protein [Halobellus limi]
MERTPDRIRALYVGADPHAAAETAAALEREDASFDVDPATADDARSAVGATSYDCVVAAYDLGPTTGVELLRTVRSSRPDLPFVLYPSAGSEAVASDAIGAGVDDYVVRSESEGGHATLAERLRSVVGCGISEDDEARRLRTFRKAVEASGHSIYCTRTDGTITYVNPTFESVSGYAAEEAIGRTPRILKSGEHDEEFYADLWETILSGEVWRSELTNSTKDGERYVVDQTIAPVEGDDGEIERFVAVNAEITDRKRRERQLWGLYESMTGWLEADSRGEICSLVDRQLSELPGFETHAVYRYEESTDRLIHTLESGDRKPDSSAQRAGSGGRSIARDVFETKRARRCERIDDVDSDAECDVRSGLFVPVDSHGVLFVGSSDPDAFDATDEAVLSVFTAALAEVIDRIDYERELQERNDRLENFASVVSHDLRNPLSVADGYLELARETGSQAHLDEVERAHDRMARIVDDLLWLAREGRTIGELRPTSLPEVVERAWEHTNAPNATLRVDCTADIAADPDRLQQLFENLFRNAREHAGEDVSVRVGHLGDGPDFYVEDDGPGIPAAERDRVFETSYTTAEDGTGYGLSIVETVVEAHGWELRLTESDAGGARFEIRNVARAETT